MNVLMALTAVDRHWKSNSTYLHNQHLLPGIVNQEVEGLAPER